LKKIHDENDNAEKLWDPNQKYVSNYFFKKPKSMGKNYMGIKSSKDIF